MSSATSRVVGVELAIAGFAEVLEDDLKRKLGHAAWHVWQVLCVHRDRQGITHITQTGIGRAKAFVPMRERNVERAMRRLEAAKLVERIGWTEREVPKGAKTVVCEVYLRRVRGARQLVSLAGAARVSVPLETKAWMRTANTHGGRRMGAGRKESSEGNPQSSGGNPPSPGAQSSEGSDMYKRARALGDGPRGSLPTEGNQAPNEVGASGLLRDESMAGMGTSFRGRATRMLPPASAPIEGLPPYPGYSICAPASVPDPPRIKPDDPEDYRVRLLASAYRGAVEREYGTKCFLLAKVSPKAKSYAQLLKAAELLAAFDVAPAAWCIFAVRRWFLARTHARGYVKGQPVPLPPIGVVFSEKQITDRLADEDKRGTVEESAVGGRIIFGNTHKALLVRYNEMRRAVMSGHAPAEAMGLFFPGSSYDDMLETARVEAKEIRHRLEDDIRRGRLVW